MLRRRLASGMLPFAIPMALRAPLLLARLVRLLAVLAIATLVFALVGFTSVAGEPRGWAKALAVGCGLGLVLVVVSGVVLARRALRALREAKDAFLHRRTAPPP